MEKIDFVLSPYFLYMLLYPLLIYIFAIISVKTSKKNISSICFIITHIMFLLNIQILFSFILILFSELDGTNDDFFLSEYFFSTIVPILVYILTITGKILFLIFTYKNISHSSWIYEYLKRIKEDRVFAKKVLKYAFLIDYTFAVLLALDSTFNCSSGVIETLLGVLFSLTIFPIMWGFTFGTGIFLSYFAFYKWNKAKNTLVTTSNTIISK